MLFSEPKIPQFEQLAKQLSKNWIVSVLFSEPKIPQFIPLCPHSKRNNSFQCSSASRKFLNSSNRMPSLRMYSVSVLFSEPKIPQSHELGAMTPLKPKFQCSSASRKFLNRSWQRERHTGCGCFSALQRAENSSIFGSGCE